MGERLVIALGGHALVKPGQRGTIPEQRANVRAALSGVVDLIREGHRVLITHGNGPQIGHILTRSEEARGKAYELPLDVGVAQSQGETGYLIQRALAVAGVTRPVVTLVTQVRVDSADPRLREPSKPVGPVCDEARADELRRRGAAVLDDPGRGLRRHVPSPRPVEIVEARLISKLFDDGVVVIAAGGGGIPLCGDEGVEAVIDKDLAAAELALAVGADRMLNLTAVENVKLRFGQPGETDLDLLTVSEAERYLEEGHFAPGTMGPKIEGALRFLRARGRGEVLITTPERALAALRGEAGTRIVPHRHLSRRNLEAGVEARP